MKRSIDRTRRAHKPSCPASPRSLEITYSQTLRVRTPVATPPQTKTRRWQLIKKYLLRDNNSRCEIRAHHLTRTEPARWKYEMGHHKARGVRGCNGPRLFKRSPDVIRLRGAARQFITFGARIIGPHPLDISCTRTLIDSNSKIRLMRAYV